MSARIAVAVAAGILIGAAQGQATEITPSAAELQASVSPIDPQVFRIKAVPTGVASRDDLTGGSVVRLRSDILFSFGSAGLSAAATDRIGQIVESADRGSAIAVEGHTDSVGSRSSNARLSLARARAVAEAIRTSRPDLRTTVRGFGERRPVAPNQIDGRDNSAGRAKNRRVELRASRR